MQRTKVRTILQQARPGERVCVCGWIRTKREAKGGLTFLELNDGSCLTSLQLVVEGQSPAWAQLLRQVSTGASVRATGDIVESPGKGQRVELHVDALEVLGTADPLSYPLQKKGHSFEFLREKAHLRPRTNTFGALARIRNTLCFAIHQFFQDRGFLYIHTPIITTSDCEGAGQLFQVTTLDLQRLAVRQQALSGSSPTGAAVEVDYSQDFFGRKASLTVSGQLEAETYACALGEVYTFGPTFRAENSNTTRHLAEFWMVEPEMAFYDLADNMRLAEEFVRYLVRTVLTRCAEDLAFFDQRIEPGLVSALETLEQQSFEHLSYTQAIEILQQSGQSFEFPVTWGCDLQSEHERYLTEQYLKRPVILTDYPRSIKPFYMRCNEDGRTVRAMDVLVPRIGEIIGGSQREERCEVLLQRMHELGLDPEAYWWYVDLRRYGTVPHAGFGLGVERTLQWITGMGNIRDCIPFPRTPKNAEF
ncbi:MAG: asparagine--tRNA ligase [Planctomycetaceae bacterium]|nr:MAG: asparagine--tRNA ligase [Planctomycetaceae bacterium]